jgi:hypothetical protein
MLSDVSWHWTYLDVYSKSLENTYWFAVKHQVQYQSAQYKFAVIVTHNKFHIYRICIDVFLMQTTCFIPIGCIGFLSKPTHTEFGNHVLFNVNFRDCLHSENQNDARCYCMALHPLAVIDVDRIANFKIGKLCA